MYYIHVIHTSPINVMILIFRTMIRKSIWNWRKMFQMIFNWSSLVNETKTKKPQSTRTTHKTDTYECRPCDTVASLTNDAMFVWTCFFFATEASSSNLLMKQSWLKKATEENDLIARSSWTWHSLLAIRLTTFKHIMTIMHIRPCTYMYS